MFLANENFPKSSINLLRSNGLVVRSIQEERPGIPDKEVVQTAVDSKPGYPPFDKDYGEIIFRYSPDKKPDVIFFRNKEDEPIFAGNLLLKLISDGFGFENAFTVVEAHSIRQRFYE